MEINPSCRGRDKGGPVGVGVGVGWGRGRKLDKHINAVLASL